MEKLDTQKLGFCLSICG